MAAGGWARLGFTRGPNLGLSLAVRAPEAAFDPESVFLHPAGVVNAASFGPFTAGVAPGELITLYGANLAPETAAAAVTPLPTSLAGVQTLVNDRPAPLLWVSPGQLAAMVPYSTAGPIASIQVVNNGVASKPVTTFVNRSAPGVFAIPPDGVSTAAARHADYTLVDALSPAAPGEIVLLYVTGLGAVTPAVADGDAGPVGPLSVVEGSLSVSIGGAPARIHYAGLAPGFAGLYQINCTVPESAEPGWATVAVAGPDSLTAQASLPIRAGAAAVREQSRRPRPALRSLPASPLQSATQPRFRWDRK